MKMHNRKSLILFPLEIRAVLELEEWNDVSAPNFGRKKSSSILTWFLEMLRVFLIVAFAVTYENLMN